MDSPSATLTSSSGWKPRRLTPSWLTLLPTWWPWSQILQLRGCGRSLTPPKSSRAEPPCMPWATWLTSESLPRLAPSSVTPPGSKESTRSLLQWCFPPPANPNAFSSGFLLLILSESLKYGLANTSLDFKRSLTKLAKLQSLFLPLVAIMMQTIQGAPICKMLLSTCWNSLTMSARGMKTTPTWSWGYSFSRLHYIHHYKIAHSGHPLHLHCDEFWFYVLQRRSSGIWAEPWNR